jgi:hypothetical protein
VGTGVDMSFEDELQDFLTSQDLKPEDVFSMVTIMPKKKIKVTAYLEDKDGDRILVSEIAENLVNFVNEQLRVEETTPVNYQLFPLCGQFMTSIVPRFIGLELANVMFEANTFRQALLTLSLSSVLFMQYIEQHELKIITEVVQLSDEEVTNYFERSQESDRRLRNLLQGLLDNDNE